MPAGQFLSSDLTQRYSHALLQALRGARASRTADTPDHPSATQAGGAVIERAKGALMMRYGIDSYQALAVLVRWARVAQLPVRNVAHTFLHGICQGDPQTEARERPLVRWLEDQLRQGDPDLP